MGTFLIYRIAGGEAGMGHFLAQFGPALKLPWTKLEAPELTQGLIDEVSAQSDTQAAGVAIRDLERQRDDCLVAVLGGLRAQDYGAGATLKAYERQLLGRLSVSADAPNLASQTAPLPTFAGRVLPDWIDYNGHMTEHRYLQCFGDASDALLRRIGVDGAYLSGGHSFYTAETHMMHRGQARADDPLAATTQVLAADPKRLHLFHVLTRGDGAVVATAEQMLLHVDTAVDRVAAAEGAVLAAMTALAEAHAGLPRPADAGRCVGVRRGPS